MVSEVCWGNSQLKKDNFVNLTNNSESIENRLMKLRSQMERLEKQKKKLDSIKGT